MTYSQIEVRRLSPMIGAEVFGADLSQPLALNVLAEIKAALVANQVIFFRDQTLSIDQHKKFCRHWGELFLHPGSSSRTPEHPELITISADENSKRVAGEEWHTDTSCEAAPPMGSVLHMHVVPECGGDTLFASMYAAYEGLSERMKQTLAGLTAHHSAEAVYRDFYGTNLDYPKCDHPVVCVHPDSGRRLLFVNRFYTTKINGLPSRESRDLLAFLFNHIETPEYQCRFRWQPGSIAFWDNRCTQHRAIFDYYPARRKGFRIQICGTPPLAAS